MSVEPLHAAGPAARRARRNRLVGAAISLGAHLAVLAGFLWPWPQPPDRPEPEPITVTLVDELPPTAPAPAPKPTPKSPAPAHRHAAAKPKTAPKPARRALASLMKPRPVPSARATETTPVAGATAIGLTDADLAGATSADSLGGGGSGNGGGGGACDMARRIQAALRRDRLVQAAVAQARMSGAGARAILVWNGDWVQNLGEDGKGLSAVREAILWEVGFAPKACRAESVRGLILLSVASGAPRLALGSGSWRWGDLLRMR